MSDLNQQLKAWGRRRDDEHAPSTEAIVERTRQRLAAPAPAPAHLERHLRYTRLALAASLALLVGLTALYLWRLNAPATMPQPGQPAPMAAGISPSDLADLRQAIGEVQRLFPEGVRWISLVNGQLSVQVGQPKRIETGGNQSGSPLLVRYQLMRRGNGGDWQLVSTHDIVTFADEPVGSPTDASLSLWCHLVTPSMALVETDITIDGVHVSHQAPQALSTSIIVFERRDNGQSIRVVQTISPI